MTTDRRVWIAGAVAIGVFGALAALRSANHDVSWYVHMAGVILDGGTAYVDAVDTNPPLIVMLTLVPVWAARLVGVSPTLGFYVGVVLLAAVSSLWSSRLIARAWPTAGPALQGLLAMGVVFLLFPFPKGDVGQREHLAVILVLPYVLAAALRAAGGSLPTAEAVVAGVAGAVGFAIKPHFLLAWIAVELALLAIQRRSFLRPELAAAASTFVVYGAVVFLVFPEYLDVARRVWTVYGALNSPVARLISLRELQIGLVAFALIVLLKLPRNLAAPLWILGATAAGFLAASILQLKGWGYHMLPAQVFLALVLLAIVTSVFQTVPQLDGFIRGGSTAVFAAAALVLVGMSGKYAVEQRPRSPNDPLSVLAGLVREHAPGGPIAVLAMRTLVFPSFPLVNETGARWSLRHHSLWFLTAFYERELASTSATTTALHTPAQMVPLERAFYEEILSDLCAAPPKLLVIERASPLAPGGRRALDLEAYYGQDARFARLFSAYQALTDVAQFKVYKAEKEPTCNQSPSHN